MLSLAVMVSCGGNSNSTTATSEDKVEAEAAPETEAPSFTTPDLILCDVKGHVKEIIQNGDWLVARFNKEGALMNYHDRDRISNVERDEKGRLVAFLGGDWMKVEWTGDWPSSINGSMNEWSNTETYTRDDDGRIVKIIYHYEFAGESPETKIGTIEYGADSFDSQGNWIKRTVIYSDGNKETEERTITYFE